MTDRAPASIVALAMTPWLGPWMNRQQIMSRLGRIYPTLYSTGVLSTWDWSRPDRKALPWCGAYVHTDNVWVDQPPALLLRAKNYPSVDAQIIRIAARRLRRRARALHGGAIIGYVFHPRMWPYAKALRPDLLVYHAYDLFKHQVGWSPTVAAWQRDLVALADVTIGSSSIICEELRSQGARDPTLATNAVDADAFATDPTGSGPADLAAIPRPRVGYVGRLNRKVDLQLIADLAERHPSWQFAIVGGHDRLDKESAAGVERAQRIPNVHFLGFKPHRDLPGYVARMDVNIMCYRMGDDLWTRGGFPLKLFEYLAAGPPVISAPLPSVLPYADVISIARTPGEWDTCLTAVLEQGSEQGSRQARQRIAAHNTWDQRVALIDGLLREAVFSRR